MVDLFHTDASILQTQPTPVAKAAEKMKTAAPNATDASILQLLQTQPTPFANAAEKMKTATPNANNGEGRNAKRRQKGQKHVCRKAVPLL